MIQLFRLKHMGFEAAKVRILGQPNQKLSIFAA